MSLMYIQWSTQKLYQLFRIIILVIFLYIAYVYDQFFTCPNDISTNLGRVDIDFFSTYIICFYKWCVVLIMPAFSK